MMNKEIKKEYIKDFNVSELVPYAKNPRINDKAVEGVIKSIKRNGNIDPCEITEDNILLTGHSRLKAFKKMGIKTVDVIRVTGLTESQKKSYRVEHNKTNEAADWDFDMLREEFEMEELEDMDFDIDMSGDDEEEKEPKVKLTDRFLIPPFSILDTRQGYWQDRKRAWNKLGIKSEVGRDATTFNMKDWSDKKSEEGKMKGNKLPSDTSIFDPVLTEISCTWFSKKDDTILDPFAGGSVRGIVASKIGRQYIGIDLREEQVQANREQGNEIISQDELMPVWKTGDSTNILNLCKDVEADLLFTCPPYADLEVYSDDPKDLSTMEYSKFKEVYFDIINKSCKLLKDNRFAVIVIGEVRDKKGNYYNFVGDTIQAFLEAGLSYYNEVVLSTSLASASLRASKQFSSGRKVVKTHQNVLVFLKGNAKKATEHCGEINIYIPENEEEV